MPNNRYERKQGSLPERGKKLRTINVNFTKLDKTQGQTLKEWEELGILAELMIKVQQLCSYTIVECQTQGLITHYHNCDFPENFDFTPPRHVTVDKWWTCHIKPNSKEVVAGYFEDDVFYVIFLDKDHTFWKIDLQARGKNKR